MFVVVVYTPMNLIISLDLSRSYIYKINATAFAKCAIASKVRPMPLTQSEVGVSKRG